MSYGFLKPKVVGSSPAGPFCGEPAQSVREPVGQAREIIEGEQVALLAAIMRCSRESARTGAALGSISALSSLERTVLAESCSPDIASSG